SQRSPSPCLQPVKKPPARHSPAAYRRGDKNRRMDGWVTTRAAVRKACAPWRRGGRADSFAAMRVRPLLLFVVTALASSAAQPAPARRPARRVTASDRDARAL